MQLGKINIDKFRSDIYTLMCSVIKDNPSMASNVTDRTLAILAGNMTTPEKWIVTCADTSESADGKPRVLAVCDSEDEAKAYVRNDMEGYVDDAAGMNLTVDFDKMSVHTEDYSYGCEWNIEKID